MNCIIPDGRSFNRSSISAGNGQTIYAGSGSRSAISIAVELQASERHVKAVGRGGRGVAVVSRRIVEFK